MKKLPVFRLIFAGLLAVGLSLAFTPLHPAHAAESAPTKVKSHASGAAITTEIKARFLAEKRLKSLDLKVKTRKNVVTLRGQVQQQSQADLAVKIAQETEGVRKVVNKISVMP